MTVSHMSISRTAQVRTLLDHHGLDAVVFFHCPNLHYLCGFTGTDGVLVVAADQSVFLTDSRYTSQAREQVCADQVLEYPAKWQGCVDFLRRQGYSRLGFEAETLTWAAHERLNRLVQGELEWVPLDKPLQRLRLYKDAAELSLLEEAATIAAKALDQILPLVRPGSAERDIALELEFAMRRLGAQASAFDIIVASGPRGALPHGVASERQLQAGELVTIDYGAKYRGYHSDETVTLALGEVSGRLRQVYDTVREAHDRAIAALRPGMSLRELDAIARDHIVSCGFGEYFGHGLGHGVGLEIHEFPAVSPRAEDLIEEGMVITIEPGIYLPDEGGVRIEDMVVVTADGCRILTKQPKQFRRVC